MISHCGCTEAPIAMAKLGGSKDKAKVPISFMYKKSGVEFQDAKYGKGNRIFNLTRHGNAPADGMRCSICLKVKGMG